MTDHARSRIGEWVPALPATLLAVGENVAVELNERSVLVCQTSDGLFAIANQCSHAAMPLLGGRIRGHHLNCPVHGARIDLRTGAASGLAQRPIETFPVEVRGNQIFVCL
jgi:3-phenylpropionate/trans-cinnamate dioxygenase ferredoxin subunit